MMDHKPHQVQAAGLISWPWWHFEITDFCCSYIPSWLCLQFLKWKHLLCFCFEIPWNVTTPFQSPSKQHSGATGLLSEGGKSRDDRQSNPESVSQRQLLKRKLTNNLAHISSPELGDNTRNTKLGIIIISSTRSSVGWLLTHRKYSFACSDLPWLARPSNNLEHGTARILIKGGYLTDRPGQKYPAVKSLCHLVCHIVTGTWNHLASFLLSPPLPFLLISKRGVQTKSRGWNFYRLFAGYKQSIYI